MTRTVDAVVIGSGHNALVAAAYLARAGWEVEVIERAGRPGGAVTTEEVTVPGYLHDTFSSWHPLFHTSGAWAELGDEIRARGLQYAKFRRRHHRHRAQRRITVVSHRDPERTAAELRGADGCTYLSELQALGAHMPALGELLATELHSARAVRLIRGWPRRWTPARAWPLPPGRWPAPAGGWPSASPGRS